MSEFEGKRILITGAGSGFGKLLSEKLAEQGARLNLSDVNGDSLKTHVEFLRSSYQAEIHSDIVDVSSEAQVKHNIDAGVKHFGGLDIAVNNAGMALGRRSLLEITEEEFDKVFAINTKGVFFGIKHEVPHMLENGGCILNVSSIAGILAAPGTADYAAAKHAVSGLTKTAASEFGRMNVRVNAICPYFTPTAIIKDMTEKEAVKYSAIVPMKRLGRVEEVVAAMINMIQPSNGYLNGQCLAIDGGMSTQ